MRATADDVERLYRERFPAFLRVAVALVGEEAGARDAVHDGFVRALRHRRRWRGDGPLEGWVWRIVVNEARKRRAHDGRYVAVEAAEPSTNGGLIRIARDPAPREDFPWSNGSPEGFALFLRVTGLAESYRDSLESGRARLLGESEVDGVRVHWIDAGTVYRRDGDGVWDIWGLDVAVSRETHRPLAVRMTRDGEPWAPGTARILLFETLPEDAFPAERSRASP